MNRLLMLFIVGDASDNSFHCISVRSEYVYIPASKVIVKVRIYVRLYVEQLMKRRVV